VVVTDSYGTVHEVFGNNPAGETELARYANSNHLLPGRGAAAGDAVQRNSCFWSSVTLGGHGVFLSGETHQVSERDGTNKTIATFLCQ